MPRRRHKKKRRTGLHEGAELTLKIWGPGVVTLDDGTMVVDSIDNSNGGTFLFVTGSLTINNGIGVGSGSPFLGSFSVNLDQHLITPLRRPSTRHGLWHSTAEAFKPMA